MTKWMLTQLTIANSQGVLYPHKQQFVRLIFSIFRKCYDNSWLITFSFLCFSTTNETYWYLFFSFFLFLCEFEKCLYLEWLSFHVFSRSYDVQLIYIFCDVIDILVLAKTLRSMKRGAHQARLLNPDWTVRSDRKTCEPFRFTIRLR